MTQTFTFDIVKNKLTHSFRLIKKILYISIFGYNSSLFVWDIAQTLASNSKIKSRLPNPHSVFQTPYQVAISRSDWDSQCLRRAKFETHWLCYYWPPNWRHNWPIGTARPYHERSKQTNGDLWMTQTSIESVARIRNFILISCQLVTFNILIVTMSACGGGGGGNSTQNVNSANGSINDDSSDDDGSNNNNV